MSTRGWMLSIGIAEVCGMILGGIIILLVRRWELVHGRIDKVDEPRHYLRDFGESLIGFPVILVLSEVMIWFIPYMIRGIDSALGLIGLRLTQIVVGLVVLLVGAGLFVFKKMNLQWYGRVEVLFAAAVAIVTARQFGTQPNWLPIMGTLGGCVYVVTRGLGNMLEGAAIAFHKEYDALKKPQR